MKDYQKKSMYKYFQRFDRRVVYLPKGAADVIRSRGWSVNGLVNDLLRAWADVEGVADYPTIVKKKEDTRRADVIAETVAAVVVPGPVQPVKVRPRVTLDDFLL